MLLKLILILTTTLNIEDCIENKGFLKTNQECQCNDRVCSPGQYCDTNQCYEMPSNPFGFTTVNSWCKFDKAYINDELENTVRVVNNQFRTVHQINGIKYQLLDVGEYYQTIHLISNCELNLPNCFDVIVKKFSWIDEQELNKVFLKNMDISELREGKNINEVIMISRYAIDHKLTRDSSGIMILDFSKYPPTYEEIIVKDQINPENFWGTNSKEDDWMHATSAGRTNDGGYYIYSLNGSFLLVFDSNKQQLYNVSTDPKIKSDMVFEEKEDKIQNAHDTHQLPTGNWLSMDNGINRPEDEGGPISRCIEYSINSKTKRVKKEHEFRPLSNPVCFSNGSCRKRPGGYLVAMFNNCVTVDELKEHGNTEGLEQYQKNQIYEVDIQNKEVCSAEIPQTNNINIQRLIPSKTYKIKYLKQKQVTNNQSKTEENQNTQFLILAILILTVFVLLMSLYLQYQKQNLFEDKDKNIEFEPIKERMDEQ